MCLALPYRIVGLIENGRATAEGPDGLRTISLNLLGDTLSVSPGDHVLVAYGSAIRRVTMDEAQEILEAFGVLQEI
jgi:hydrogenase assembly chaperone HypC/HupF